MEKPENFYGMRGKVLVRPQDFSIAYEIELYRKDVLYSIQIFSPHVIKKSLGFEWIKSEGAVIL